jgi:DNA gyrase subunit B
VLDAGAQADRKGLCVYRGISLYEINSRDKTWFVYSDAEKNRVTEELSGQKVTISARRVWAERGRLMWMTTMYPRQTVILS